MGSPGSPGIERKSPSIRAKEFAKEHIWVGQSLDSAVLEEDKGTWYRRNRKLVGVLIPAVFFHFWWWSFMISNNAFSMFVEESGSKMIPRWYMSITMIFGSILAGATSEGGAAVAFPVMTLLFGIKPSVARDFSFMIQSCGMTAAAFTIWFMKVQIEPKSVVCTTLGGAFGICFGLSAVAPHLPPAYSKMIFVSVWFAFAMALYMLNRSKGRMVHDDIKNFTLNTFVVLFAFGFMGGVFSSISGSGIDICSFACLTLYYRISEKIATPTSVVLMAINTCVGFAWRVLVMGGVEPDAYGFLAVCVPIVVFGAPFGSVLGSHLHRLVLAGLIYLTDTVQFIGALAIVRPWSNPKIKDHAFLTTLSACIVIFGWVFFVLLSRAGLQNAEVKAVGANVTSTAKPSGHEGAESKQSQV